MKEGIISFMALKLWYIFYIILIEPPESYALCGQGPCSPWLPQEGSTFHGGSLSSSHLWRLSCSGPALRWDVVGGTVFFPVRSLRFLLLSPHQMKEFHPLPLPHLVVQECLLWLLLQRKDSTLVKGLSAASNVKCWASYKILFLSSPGF